MAAYSSTRSAPPTDVFPQLNVDNPVTEPRISCCDCNKRPKRWKLFTFAQMERFMRRHTIGWRRRVKTQYVTCFFGTYRHCVIEDNSQHVNGTVAGWLSNSEMNNDANSQNSVENSSLFSPEFFPSTRIVKILTRKSKCVRFIYIR